MSYYYSKKLNLYVSQEPLKINSSISSVIKNNTIECQWDDYGNITNIDFDSAKRLVSLLDGFILSPKEYWILYKEAALSNNKELLSSLTSSSFTEIMDRIYLEDNSYIDHPKLLGNYKYEGNKIPYEIVKGRPGWITADDIDLSSGHPISIRNKEKISGLFKYWSPDLSVTKIGACFALRGYVTSVAMPSLDLGIPVDSKQPKEMIRICFKKEPKGYLSKKEINEAEEYLKETELNKLEYFINSDLFYKIKNSEDNDTLIIKEKLYSNIGNLRVSNNIFGNKTLKYEDFIEYIFNIKNIFYDSLEKNKKIVFVVGHKNPDSDTVVSSIFEAYRNHIENTDSDVIYLPFIQANQIPAEINAFLKSKISNFLLYEKDINIGELLKTKSIKFIYTDQNYQKEFQKYVININDHHLLSANLKLEEIKIPILLELVGSCTSLITRKFIGQGYNFDTKLSKILYCGMLMDTENRVIHKMTAWDYKIMDIFKEKSKTKSDDELYSSLMLKLTKEKNYKKLYTRDYKSFWGYGFATVKMYNCFENNKFKYDSIIKNIIKLAKKDNKNNNYYFTLIKLVSYKDSGLNIERERIYYVFNNNSTDIIKSKLKELLNKIITVSFSNSKILETDEFIEITNVGKQLSRKKIANSIELLLKHYAQYIYSNQIKKWIKRDFLQLNDSIIKYNKDIKYDKNKRICDINYIEAKKLLNYLNMEMLNLKEFWLVYKEMQKIKDIKMIESFNGNDFVEFLDTISIEKNKIIYNPKIINDKLTGKIKYVELLNASPGLIHPNEIDYNTGLPSIIRNPDEFYNKSLWRYWSPPEDNVYVFSRSFIFLLSQTCLDAKTLVTESFENLGIRPIRKNNLNIDIKIEILNKTLTLNYKDEYNDNYIQIYKDSDFIE